MNTHTNKITQSYRIRLGIKGEDIPLKHVILFTTLLSYKVGLKSYTIRS